MKRLALALILPLVATGCTDPHYAGLEKWKLPEARLRMKECNELSDYLKPSRDISGGGTAMGVGLNFRTAEFRNTGAQNQYLIAMNAMIAACRKWARQETDRATYDKERLRVADIAMNALDAAYVSQRLDDIVAAFQTARQGTPPDNAEVLAELATIKAGIAKGEQLSELSQLQRSVDQIKEDMRKWPQGPEPGSGPGRDPAPATSLVISTVRFANASSSPNAGDLKALAATLEAYRRTCPAPDISVFGYADRSGAIASNILLSQFRATTVAMQVRALGYDVAFAGGGGATDRLGGDAQSNRVSLVRIMCRSPAP